MPLTQTVAGIIVAASTAGHRLDRRTRRGGSVSGDAGFAGW
jgi:hypothetical protein